MDVDNSLFQKLMDQAYDRWQSNRNWSKQEFWDQLDAKERIAVYCGNLNYQVCNGGWLQYWDNSYATPETIGFLQRFLPKIGTPAAIEVNKLIGEFWTIVDEKSSEDWNAHNRTRWGDYDEDSWETIHQELEPLCNRFYQINEQFVQDVEDYLNKN